MINTIIGEETKQIDLLKDDIRKLNKKISDVEVILQLIILTLHNRKKRKDIELQ